MFDMQNICFLNFYINDKIIGRGDKVSQRRCYLYIFITGCLWGIIGCFVKILENLGSSAAYSAFLRMFLGFVVLFTYCVLREGYQAFKVSKKTMLSCIMIGIFSQGLYNLTYNLAIERIGVSYSAIILNISPLFTTVLSAVFFKERIQRCKQIGITINIIGCLLTVLSSFSEQGSTIIPIGFLFAFITAVCYAVCPIFGKLTDERDSALAVATYSAFFASLFLLILNPVKEVINPLDIKILLVGFMFAVFTTGIADVFYYAGVKNIADSSKVPIFASSSLFVSAILSVIIFKENINLLKLVGLMMVFISIRIKGKQGINPCFLTLNMNNMCFMFCIRKKFIYDISCFNLEIACGSSITASVEFFTRHIMIDDNMNVSV